MRERGPWRHRRLSDWIVARCSTALTAIVAALPVALLAAAASADELKGTVLDAMGRPKSSVLIDVLGPTKVFTETDSDGHFSVEVSTGRYIIRIRDDRRRAEVEVLVEGDTARIFRVSW